MLDFRIIIFINKGGFDSQNDNNKAIYLFIKCSDFRVRERLYFEKLKKSFVIYLFFLMVISVCVRVQIGRQYFVCRPEIVSNLSQLSQKIK